LPIWTSKLETAKRVRSRIGAALDWAKSNGLRAGENPIRALSLPRQNKRTKHHAAITYRDVPEFVTKLRSFDRISESTRLAFELLILTATRTNEVIGAKWKEVDLIAAGRFRTNG
jgi:integrase